eukprot:scaffold48_cov395-Prasinococcus_capsulatus_cf.AAC.33
MSIELSPGTVMPILNLRGRYRSPWVAHALVLDVPQLHVLGDVLHELLAVQPHVVVGTPLRREEVRHVVGPLLRVPVLRPVGVRSRRRHDVAVHVTASGQGGSHVLNHRREHRLQILLQNAVHLVRLTGREAEGAVSKLIRKVVHGLVQLVGHLARRLAGAHHELVELALAEGTLLAVVLHVAAVELHELGRGFVDAGGLGLQLVDERVSQVLTVLLNNLDLAALLHLRLFGNRDSLYHLADAERGAPEG